MEDYLHLSDESYSVLRRYTNVLFTLLRPTSCWREMQFGIISLLTIHIDSTHNERRSFLSPVYTIQPVVKPVVKPV